MIYHPPKLYFNGHLETILPAITRKVNEVNYERERINTSDEDFLDLDWLIRGSKDLIIISHGLEGDSHRPYVKGMAKAFYQDQFDVLAWNYRGCSGEVNKKLRFYHSGATDDLDEVIDHSIKKGYQRIYLIGFSLGGNITLKYLGEKGAKINPKIKGGVTFSVPLNLHSSCITISKRSNFIYSKRFLINLKKKVKVKFEKMPDQLDVSKLDEIQTLIAFDDNYTAPIHGFKDAVHYYESCSSINFLDSIAVPTLIVNALNDPFLADDCYPHEALQQHTYVKLETPKRGGHVGFTAFNEEKLYWSEKRAVSFVKELKKDNRTA